MVIKPKVTVTQEIVIKLILMKETKMTLMRFYMIDISNNKIIMTLIMAVFVLLILQ